MTQVSLANDFWESRVANALRLTAIAAGVVLVMACIASNLLFETIAGATLPVWLLKTSLVLGVAAFCLSLLAIVFGDYMSGRCSTELDMPTLKSKLPVLLLATLITGVGLSAAFFITYVLASVNAAL
ncbi:MAG: hypothetical protein AAGI44_20365 [Pseudomonadota bacterium]